MSEFLNSFISNLQKKDEIKRLSEIDYFKDTSAWLSTGIPILDYRLNTLGYPVGIIEIRGKSQSGKTTLSLLAIRQAQKKHKDCIVVILSTERRDNKVYAKSLGIDVDKVIVIQCRSIEDVLNKTKLIIEEGKAKWDKAGMAGKPKFCFVWDSLGATISSQERKALDEASEKGDEDHHKTAMAAAARALKRLFRFLTGEIYDNDIWFFVINHTYDSMQAFGGSKSYGGTAIEFHPTLRLNVSKMSYVKIRDEKRGQISRISVVKSDYNSYLGDIDVELFLGKGFVLSDLELTMAESFGLLTPHKKGYSFMDGKLLWSSKPEMYELYESGNPLLKVLETKLFKCLHDEVLKNRQEKLVEVEDEDLKPKKHKKIKDGEEE